MAVATALEMAAARNDEVFLGSAIAAASCTAADEVSLRSDGAAAGCSAADEVTSSLASATSVTSPAFDGAATVVSAASTVTASGSPSGDNRRSGRRNRRRKAALHEEPVAGAVVDEVEREKKEGEDDEVQAKEDSTRRRRGLSPCLVKPGTRPPPGVVAAAAAAAANAAQAAKAVADAAVVASNAAAKAKEVTAALAKRPQAPSSEPAQAMPDPGISPAPSPALAADILGRLEKKVGSALMNVHAAEQDDANGDVRGRLAVAKATLNSLQCDPMGTEETTAVEALVSIDAALAASRDGPSEQAIRAAQRDMQDVVVLCCVRGAEHIDKVRLRSEFKGLARGDSSSSGLGNSSGTSVGRSRSCQNGQLVARLGNSLHQLFEREKRQEAGGSVRCSTRAGRSQRRRRVRPPSSPAQPPPAEVSLRSDGAAAGCSAADEAVEAEEPSQVPPPASPLGTPPLMPTAQEDAEELQADEAQDLRPPPGLSLYFFQPLRPTVRNTFVNVDDFETNSDASRPLSHAATSRHEGLSRPLRAAMRRSAGHTAGREFRAPAEAILQEIEKAENFSMPKHGRKVIAELLDELPDVRTWALVEAWVEVCRDKPKDIYLGWDQLEALIAATAKVALRFEKEEAVLCHCIKAIGTLDNALSSSNWNEAWPRHVTKANAVDEATRHVAEFCQRSNRLSVQQVCEATLLRIVEQREMVLGTARWPLQADTLTAIRGAVSSMQIGESGQWSLLARVNDFPNVVERVSRCGPAALDAVLTEVFEMLKSAIEWPWQDGYQDDRQEDRYRVQLTNIAQASSNEGQKIADACVEEALAWLRKLNQGSHQHLQKRYVMERRFVLLGLLFGARAGVVDPLRRALASTEVDEEDVTCMVRALIDLRAFELVNAAEAQELCVAVSDLLHGHHPGSERESTRDFTTALVSFMGSISSLVKGDDLNRIVEVGLWAVKSYIGHWRVESLLYEAVRALNQCVANFPKDLVRGWATKLREVAEEVLNKTMWEDHYDTYNKVNTELWKAAKRLQEETWEYIQNDGQ
eukprot:TRINITY_DN21807_c0_g1_i1.p1 TRINITY_DN21807_c0_g1~~TRINITY_DN21807_c0_g1_i1.p1  ORF type:complete len:1034 (+),score=260.99 TRINITY_DN21807_c0_g1_i1:62-3163(+)